MGQLQQSLEKLPTQPRGTILVRSKLGILFLGWFPSVPFFVLSRTRERKRRKRERERETQPQKTRERWVWSSVWIRIPAVPQIEVEGRMGWVIRLIGTYLTITCRRLCLSFHFYFIERERVKERFSYIQYARNVMYVLTCTVQYAKYA